jgi:hypothetical protein
VKQLRLSVLAMFAFAAVTPAFAQRSHPGGGPPAGAGASGSRGPAGAGGNGNPAAMGSSGGHMDSMHASPSDVLSHNTAIAGKIKTLTGEEAATACSGFKNLGQCVAAAHVSKNLDIPGGFDALKAKTTGTGSVSLGKAIEQLAPGSNGKSEAKRANKQAQQDLDESGS